MFGIVKILFNDLMREENGIVVRWWLCGCEIGLKKICLYLRMCVFCFLVIIYIC